MIDLIRAHAIPAAYDVLPPAMASREATALLLAIGYQESRFAHRQQVKGPARGFWQFEMGGGVVGVLGHPTTQAPARSALKALAYRYDPTPHGCYAAIEHNDVLAVVFARLLLWTLPGALPGRQDEGLGWRQYLAAWRPGKPHAETWSEAWKMGWNLA